jgi:orotidine-5'-phosphate decarboxylase
MHFLKKLKKALRETGTHLIVGLDTDVNRIPKFLLNYLNPVTEFNRIIIESTKDYVCGYKLNTAFYESYGVKGWEAIRDTLKLIPENLITIADVKRGDIENTTEHYAKAFLDVLGFDAVTAHPYMGQDSVRPFLRRKNKFVFVLALTSNYGYKDFQLLKVGQKPLWEVVIEKAHKWNEEKIGFVIGAKHTKELKKVTEKYPDIPLLIPGIGAQRGSAEKMLASLKHNMWVVNQSRSIIYCKPNAKDKKELFDAVREAVIKASLGLK